MKNYQFGVVVGRFQPLHNGHCKVIDLARDNCERVAVFIGSAQEFGTVANPLDYEMRKHILRTRYEDDIEIYPLNDLTDGSDVTGEWGKYLLQEIYRQAGAYPDVFFSGAEPIRTKWFYPEDVKDIDEITVSRTIIPVSATEIRQAILNDQWETVAQNVPLATLTNYQCVQQLLKAAQRRASDE